MRNLILVVSAGLFSVGEATAEPAHHHVHSNHAALFVGATTLLASDNATHPTVGGDYERRLPFAKGVIGVGGLIDTTIASEVETILAPFVSLHPVGGLTLVGAAGIVVANLGDASHLVLRGGASYLLDVGPLSVGPTLNIDHIEESAIVYGVSAGTGF